MASASRNAPAPRRSGRAKPGRPRGCCGRRPRPGSVPIRSWMLNRLSRSPWSPSVLARLNCTTFRSWARAAPPRGTRRWRRPDRRQGDAPHPDCCGIRPHRRQTDRLLELLHAGVQLARFEIRRAQRISPLGSFGCSAMSRSRRRMSFVSARFRDMSARGSRHPQRFAAGSGATRRPFRPKTADRRPLALARPPDCACSPAELS